jgi:hypothetical protein
MAPCATDTKDVSSRQSRFSFANPYPLCSSGINVSLKSLSRLTLWVKLSGALGSRARLPPACFSYGSRSHVGHESRYMRASVCLLRNSLSIGRTTRDER